jgi:hypothetical protein
MIIETYYIIFHQKGGTMKVIKVKTCDKCPYIHFDDGGGYCDEFTICEKYNILLTDITWFDIHNKIHPDCKLEDA